MEKKNFSSNLKLGKFKSLLDNLNSDQRDLIKSCGFGTILDFDCSEAPRSVSFWLAKRFDVQTRIVNLQNGSSFVINPYTVHQILGIPLGGRKIPTRATKHVKDIIGNDTGTASIAPTVDKLFGLVNNELSGDKFVRVFMLIALAIFLCPTSYGSASSHYYSAIASVKDIPKYDWCSFVLDWLVTSIEKFQESTAKGNALGKDKTSSLGGCLFVLAVTYFEYIDTTQILLRDDIPRLKIWDDYMIQEFLALDGNSGDGRSFGMLQIFSTKLSLPKFMSVSKMLTLEQRRLVSTMGFHHLLDLCCDSVPRGISIWLAKSFDVKSRTLLLSNGSRISITPLSVHRVLGIPNGGKAITKKCEDCVKNWISQETRCKGSTPTINELKALFTPQLRGNNFKMVFTLFAVSSFLCPTSYGSASTDYYSAIALPDEISEYDWCAAVLDKITQSIEFYQKTEATTSTATLGGCILVLVIIYFELLDIPISRDFQDIPLLKFWSTDMVKAFETLDAKDDNHTVFGRLPVKDLTRTPFWTGALADSLTSHATKMLTREYSESAQDRDKVAATIQELQRDIINAIEPIMSSYTDRIYNLWVSPQVSTKAQKHDSFGGGSNVSPQLNVANLVVERKTHTHTGDPHSVDKNQECVVTASLKTDNVNVEETDAHHSESLEPKPPLEGVLVSTKPHVTSTKEMSSFLQVPSFSQDSSSNPVSNATQPKIHSVKENRSTETSECSHSKPGPPHLQPRITLAENMATSVFQSRQSSSTNTLQRKETNASVLDIPIAEANTDDRDAEQTTKSNDFNFWGDGFDSDFEVKPPAKSPARVNFQIQANQHGKKRTRSLIESIYDAIISERKREDTASRCTTGSDQAMNNVVNGIESTPLPESFIQELNPSNFNEEFYDQINMEEIMQSTPATQTKFCYNFSSQL